MISSAEIASDLRGMLALLIMVLHSKAWSLELWEHLSFIAALVSEVVSRLPQTGLCGLRASMS